MPKITVIHENDAWLAPLSRALDRRGLPWQDWHLDRGIVDLAAVPPAGVFYNRMSASAHTRGHRYAPEPTSAVLAWLEAHGRRVANGSRALALEVNKAAQYAALYGHGLAVPRSLACVGTDAVIDAVIQCGEERSGSQRCESLPGGVRPGPSPSDSTALQRRLPRKRTGPTSSQRWNPKLTPVAPAGASTSTRVLTPVGPPAR